MSKPVVNADLCIGCGTCESMCSGVFKLEDGKSHVVNEDCESCGCACQEVVDSCPVNAISLE